MIKYNNTDFFTTSISHKRNSHRPLFRYVQPTMRKGIWIMHKSRYCWQVE